MAKQQHEVWAYHRESPKQKLNEFRTAEEAQAFQRQQAAIMAGYGLTPWERTKEDGGAIHMLDKEGLSQVIYGVVSPKRTRR